MIVGVNSYLLNNSKLDLCYQHVMKTLGFVQSLGS